MARPNCSTRSEQISALAVIDGLGYGGAERFLVSLLPELSRLGVSCQVAAGQRPYTMADELEAAGVTVHRLNLSHRWAIPEAAWKIAAIAKNNAFDVLWGHLYFGNLYAAVASRFIHLPVTWTLHSAGHAVEPLLGIWPRVRRSVERIVGESWTSSKVGVSAGVVSDYEKILNWRGMDVIHNGIPTVGLSKELSPDKRIAIRATYGASASDFLIVTPARFVRLKGHETLLRAVSLLSQERGWAPYCIAAGHGPSVLELRSLIKALGIGNQIRLCEPLPQAELFELLRSADCFVLPSLREAFGIAAAEAMALGIPAILSKTYGFTELVGDSGSAILVPPGDERSLADAIWALAADSQRRARLGQLGRRRVVENFDIAVAARKWRDHLQGVAMDSAC